MYKMERYRYLSAICLVAVALFAACTHDEGAEPGTPLPEGRYPLQIGSITLNGEGGVHTRMTDNGNSSVFQNKDVIGVRIGDSEETGEYRLIVENGQVTGAEPVKPVYWQDTEPAAVTAWYPVDKTIDFTHQDKGLAYLLKASEQASYNAPATLTFTHQLAKVRVTLTGDRTDAVSAVTVRSHVSTENDEGSRGKDSGEVKYVPMLQTSYNGQTCWEATLLKGTLKAADSFRLTPTDGGDPVQATLTSDVSIAPANVYDITITVNAAIPADATGITTGNCNDIKGTGNYVLKGSFGSSITITGGSPNIYLDNANVSLSVSGSVISIKGGNPIIHVVGNSSLNACNSMVQGGAGIFVAEGSSVTIKSADKNTNLLTVTGYQGAGIGGVATNDYGTGTDCGNITIENVTVIATSSALLGYSPGIGSCGTAKCGTITIKNAIVHATGRSDNAAAAPAIGAGMDNTMNQGSIPTIQITDSDIHAHKGSYSDYIGLPGQLFGYNGGAIQFGTGGYCRSSTVYCYTNTSSTTDKVVEYDSKGNGTEQ